MCILDEMKFYVIVAVNFVVLDTYKSQIHSHDVTPKANSKFITKFSKRSHIRHNITPKLHKTLTIILYSP